MGRFDMTMVDIGAADAELHESNLDSEFGNPQKTAYPPSLVYTVATTSFTEREPEVAKLISNISFSTDEMSALLAWQGENNSPTEEATVYFLQNNKDKWAEWLNADARQRLSKFLGQ